MCPLANFPPSAWGDLFLSFSLDNSELEGYAKALEEPKEELRRLIIDPTTDTNTKLSLIYSACTPSWFYVSILARG
ncbi:hypothetical protein L6452_34834 [Arctium lappa]|uniref:Uncharacterized protein n=1 Tax=Arctium lappa TaxID=4217 RepID=A0ACB8YNI7_ARCLA|nr:hypothetical protein L6452_34834 [Arctium lappa]